MNTRNDCIFCKIVAGEIPCTKLFEDDEVLSFMDISPLNRGHLLVIPKEHYETILDIPPELYGFIAQAICKIAKVVGASLEPHGMNVMQLNGEAGNQVVPHVHMHLVPRWFDDKLTICSWEPVLGDREDIALAAEEIKARISG